MANLSFDYSKWDKLELSDDEDTFHPNLDKNLNIRVNRITRDRKEEAVDTEVAKLEAEGDLDKAAQVEKRRPLHIGNLCKVAEERTIIHSQDGTKKDRLVKDDEEFQVDDYFEFKKEHKDLLEAFTNADWERSRTLLHKRGDILLDNCANSYFMLGALDAQMSGDTALVEKLGHQGQIISQIHQLAKPMNRHPRDLVHRFFDKFETDGGQAAFQEGVNHFLGHIRVRAEQKKKEKDDAPVSVEPEEIQEEQGEAVPLIEAMYDMPLEQRKGPGGLDPVEVFESLPPQLQDCFKSGDVERLKSAAQEMGTDEFEVHFKRCIDAGLWSPGS
jgi:cell division cycle protein 37